VRMNSGKREESFVQAFPPGTAFVDWSISNAIGPMQDQKGCGCCWTFAATAALGAWHFIKTGKFIDPSQQQLIDCDLQRPNNGCEGGNFNNAFKYATGGMAASSAYPFVLADYEEGKPTRNSCKYKANQAVTKTSSPADNSFVRLDQWHCALGNPPPPCVHYPANKTAVINALHKGPLAITMCAGITNTKGVPFVSFFKSSEVFQFSAECKQPDHAILAIGFDAKKDLIKIRNSWGKDWGDNGYAWVKATPWFIQEASFPIIA
jgi:C1A family cysteine protease